MAADFIGYAVLVTLKQPPNSQIWGTVASVVGQRLMLQDATLLWSGQRLREHYIDAPKIADLEVLSDPALLNHDHDHELSPGPTRHESPLQKASTCSDVNIAQPTQPCITDAAQKLKQQPLIDPAILSFSRPLAGSSSRHLSTTEPLAKIGSISTLADVPEVKSPTEKQKILPNSTSTLALREVQNSASTVAAALTEPFNHLALIPESNGNEERESHEKAFDEVVPDTKKDLVLPENPAKGTGRRSRRSRNKFQKDMIQQYGATDEHELPPKINTRSKGWRQTAFVEPVHVPRIQSRRSRKEGFASAKVPRRPRGNRNHELYFENPSGWATEDATDIQEMGDFDFQGNLSKFDKRRVFDQIRNDDTTADEERLVSFNKKASKPGTNGGKNLHYSENVLDSPECTWNREISETDSDPSVDKFSSGNHSGRERSRASTRAQNSRKGSTVSGQPLSIIAQASSIGRMQLSSSRTASPRQGRLSVTASPRNGPIGSATLRLTTTNRSCPTVSPLQMFEVEQLASAELGLTEEMITENAGRGIAEAAVAQLSSDSAAPAVLVLAGNHRTGARAVCAARHLRNRGHRVSLCILGLEHEDELLEHCRKQLEIFRKMGGRVFRWEEPSARLSTSDFAVDLVIDALFGIHVAFEDLRTDDQVVVFEMTSWLNRSSVPVLSVDTPSGISASSGEMTVVEGKCLCINSNFVVCLGAPKTGVMLALLSGEGASWQLAVADIGISQTVWRKYGSRHRHGVDFGNRWVVPLRYQPSAL